MNLEASESDMEETPSDDMMYETSSSSESSDTSATSSENDGGDENPGSGVVQAPSCDVGKAKRAEPAGAASIECSEDTCGGDTGEPGAEEAPTYCAEDGKGDGVVQAPSANAETETSEAPGKKKRWNLKTSKILPMHVVRARKVASRQTKT